MSAGYIACSVGFFGSLFLLRLVRSTLNRRWRRNCTVRRGLFSRGLERATQAFKALEREKATKVLCACGSQRSPTPSVESACIKDRKMLRGLSTCRCITNPHEYRLSTYNLLSANHALN